MSSYPIIEIQHAITTDLDGQPWPPTGLMTDWHLIDCANGKSRWRRISLTTTDAAAAAASVPHVGGNKQSRR
jgi:hypothetical protein